jgi:hypothetical protein
MPVIQTHGKLRVAHGIDNRSVHFERVTLWHQFSPPKRAFTALLSGTMLLALHFARVAAASETGLPADAAAGKSTTQ